VWVGVAVAVPTFLIMPAGEVLTERFDDAAWRQDAQREFDLWVETLYGKGLVPLVAELSNSPDTAFSTLLRLPAQSFVDPDTGVEIETAAVAELRQLLRRPKGSFALAGPRGAGKTTLLERWCAGHFLDRGTDGTVTRHLPIRVDAPVGYEPKEFLTHLFGRLCVAVARYAREHRGAITSGLGSERSRRGRTTGRTDPSAADDLRWYEGPMELWDLVRLAHHEEETLRYLRGRTTEREAGIDLPPFPGMNLSAKGRIAVRHDDVPLNHPELVERFRFLLRRTGEVVAAANGKVLIGIDELDRISDGEQAQKFLNELKAIFNVPKCYFLVSVSEDAMVEFELSAMGTRTVFDSAFDTIVRVDYLRFEEARRMLAQRIVNLPEQFVTLAYVLSGGLARELVRTAEEIGRIGREYAQGCELSQVTAHLVLRQLDRTTRAAMDRLSRSKDRRAGAVLLPVLDEHPIDGLTGPVLRSYAARVRTVGCAPGQEEPDLVAGIRADVSAMVHYLAILVDVFDHQLDENRMRTGLVRGPGHFDSLARVRRYLGANSYGAEELLATFARTWRIAL
jgi:hypothetical protein